MNGMQSVVGVGEGWQKEQFPRTYQLISAPKLLLKQPEKNRINRVQVSSFKLGIWPMFVILESGR